MKKKKKRNLIAEQNEAKRLSKLECLPRFYNRNSLFGNTWARIFVLVGARDTGKSYQVSDYILNRSKKKGKMCKNYWLRLSTDSCKNLLCNKGGKFADPDLVRKYDLQLTTKGQDIYNKGKKICTVLPLASMGKNKGLAEYDKDFIKSGGEINIVLDEFQLEQGEKRVSFDVVYNLIGTIENLVRAEKNNVRIIMAGNTLSESAGILKTFNFIPRKPGRYKIRKRKTIIEVLPTTKEYIEDRKESMSDLLGGSETSNYTNSILRDIELIDNRRTTKPQCIIKFGRTKDRWFTLWDHNIIKRYKNEQIKEQIAMKPYMDAVYYKDAATEVILTYDLRGYHFNNFATQAYFEEELMSVRKAK